MTGLPHAVPLSGALMARGQAAPERSRLTAAWLFAVAALVMLMVIVGGATRLTGSGLSITEWKPILGALPPLTDAAWADLFRRYRAIPQYRVVNADMTLAGFKTIFWWEWTHRLLGRLLGLVFAVPFLVLLLTRRLPSRLVWPCVGLFVLGGLQGLVGWWMVASGLETRVYVAPERLAAHLGLALILFSALVWSGLEAGWGSPKGSLARGGGWPRAAWVLLGAVYLQCLLGALVAGNHAGLANGDWPLMSGRVFPIDYWRGDLWTTVAHGMAAVQLHHRLLAYAVTSLIAVMAIQAWRSERPMIGRWMTVILALVTAQVGLGVYLLLNGVPTGAALAHQLLASLVLASVTSLAWAIRHAGIRIP